MGFSRQEYWSGLPCFPPGVQGHLPDPGIEPVSPALAGEFFTTFATWEAPEVSLESFKSKGIKEKLWSPAEVEKG